MRTCSVTAWVVAFVALASPATAAEVETRDFTVLVSGRPSGEAHMTIHRRDDGSIVMRCDTDIRVKVGIINYKFVYRGLEEWRDRHLTRLESTTDDNGKRFTVSVAEGNGGMKLRINNAERPAPADLWPTSYWSLPAPKLRAGKLNLLDADSGKLLEAQLTFVATEKLRLAGQDVTLNHYRLTGNVTVDLWYDGSERLVRQEWMEQGHKTSLELVRVRR